MRQIKFRAWSPEEKEMIIVDILMCLADGSFKVLYGKAGDAELYTMYDPIVMQFTGLVDKTGREIYEGDIVTINYDDSDKIYLRQIIWDTGAFMVKQIHGSANVWLWSYKFDTIPMNLVVIGNIYQNPDFLK